MYFSSDILYNRFLPQTMGLALSCTPKGSAALKSCANQWHQACGTDSYPKAGWAGKETSPVWPVSPALQPRWICQSCRCCLMSPWTSDLLQEIPAAVLRLSGHSTWCKRNQLWGLVSFPAVFSQHDGKPFLMVLMAVRRRDTNLCCNFLKPEHAGASHWKILWLWRQEGLPDPAHSSLTNSVVFPSSVQHLWLHSRIIPSQPRHCSNIYPSQGFETFYTRSCTPNKILLQIWDQLVWGEEQKASLREFWGETCHTVKLHRRRKEILPLPAHAQ